MPSPLISPLIPDDFARQVTFDELVTLVGTSASAGRVVLCSALIDGAATLRASIGDARADALARELALFIRKILRGSDAVAVRGEEVFVLLDTSVASGTAVAERILASVRSHMFSARTSGPSERVTLTMGVAAAPEHGTEFSALNEAARQARTSLAGDAVAAAFGPAVPAVNVNRFVGRSERLVTLIDALDHSVRGAGHVVAVIGEQGVGSSTLLRTLEPEIRVRGGSLVVGTCYERRIPSPYSLWSDVLRAVRRLPVKTTRQWRDLPLLDATLEGAGDAALHGSSKTRLLEELADFFRLAAQQRPLVLLLEDMQWCDDASWDALEYLITQLERERVLIAMTIQAGAGSDVALERWNRIASRPRHVEIRLTFLTRDDVKRWLEAALSMDDVAREVMSYVYRQSEGRPLALMHLVRDLEESGHLVYEGGGWRWNAVQALPPVSSLDTVLARRIERLLPGQRDLLELAAVLGRDADEAFFFDDDVARGRANLQPLLAGGFLVSTFDRLRAAYVIAHSEIARVVRAKMGPARAALLHDRVARALSADVAGDSSEIAEHYETAGNNAVAHRFALLAADRALSLHETGALAMLLAAAERSAPTEAALADVRVRMVSVAEVAGRYEEATALCDAALAWYVAQGDQLNSLRLKRTRALVRLKLGQGASETLTELFALESQARQANAHMERAGILLLMAQLHYRLGDTSEAQRIAAEAVGIAESGDDPVLLADASNRLAATVQLVNARQARDLFNRSLDIASTLGDTPRLVRALNNIGVLEMINNNFEASRAALNQAVELSKTGGLLEWWGRAELNRGVLAGRIGEYDVAARAFNEALRLASVAQNSEEQLYATVNLASLERDHERFREASDLYALVVELAERIGQVALQASALAGFGLCRRELGDTTAARSALERALLLSEVIEEWVEGRELVEALRLHFMIEERRYTEAVQLFETCLRLAEAVDMTGAAFLVAEFGQILYPHATELVSAAARRYLDLPDVVLNRKMRERFSVLKRDI